MPGKLSSPVLVDSRRPTSATAGNAFPDMVHLPAFVSHFRQLAQSELEVDRRILASRPFLRGLPTVPDSFGVDLQQPPTPAELQRVLSRMKSGSAPGPDGLPTEFYKTLWPVLCDFFCGVLRFFFEEQLLPPSFRLGRLVLLPKGAGSPHDPGAWRPITLLNADYKILAAVLSSRMQAVLPDLINLRQTCPVPGRAIYTLTALTRDVLEYSRTRRANGLLVSLDQDKAFDRAEHGYLFSVLSAFGLPSSSVALFESLYGDMQSELFVNGVLAARFPVTRGVRQGCPLSPLLFVLCIGPFLVGIDRASSV